MDIESCFPPRCDSDSDSFVSYDINTPSFRSSSLTSIDLDSSFTFELYPNGLILEKPNLRLFTFYDLKIATRNFKSDAMVYIKGDGTFPKVFKGWMDEKTLSPSHPSKMGTSEPIILVAVKRLSAESMQGFQEYWQSEVNFFGRLFHPNLVKLFGFYSGDEEPLLVYEFMQKGSLDYHLFGMRADFSWDMRLKIAIEAARGLAFLHSLEKRVIHRNFKISNILLDKNFNAKISMFSLAKLGPSGGDPNVSTKVMGMNNYDAPEYIATGHLNVKSDVYGFGVVLLEMIMAMRMVDTNRPRGEHHLLHWIKPRLSKKRKLIAIMDQRMAGQYSYKAALKVAQLSIKCLGTDPRSRPSMKDVLEVLEGIKKE